MGTAYRKNIKPISPLDEKATTAKTDPRRLTLHCGLSKEPDIWLLQSLEELLKIASLDEQSFLFPREQWCDQVACPNSTLLSLLGELSKLNLLTKRPRSGILGPHVTCTQVTQGQSSFYTCSCSQPSSQPRGSQSKGTRDPHFCFALSQLGMMLGSFCASGAS